MTQISMFLEEIKKWCTCTHPCFWPFVTLCHYEQQQSLWIFSNYLQISQLKLLSYRNNNLPVHFTAMKAMSSLSCYVISFRCLTGGKCNWLEECWQCRTTWPSSFAKNAENVIKSTVYVVRCFILSWVLYTAKSDVLIWVKISGVKNFELKSVDFRVTVTLAVLKKLCCWSYFRESIQ